MKFSIITVCYNAAATIEQTLVSIIEQDYENKELIVIDGFSSDDTNKIIRKYEKNISVHISEKDNGIYDAMNKGLKYITGDYVIFMNAGDCFWNSDVLRCVAERINETGAVYYGDTMYDFGDRTELRQVNVNSFTLSRRNICHQSIFYPSKAIQSLKYDLKYKYLSDWNLNIKLFRSCGFKHVDIIVSRFSTDGVSSNSNRMKDPEFIADLPQMCKTYLGFYPYLFVYLRFKVRELCKQN